MAKKSEANSPFIVDDPSLGYKTILTAFFLLFFLQFHPQLFLKKTKEEAIRF